MERPIYMDHHATTPIADDVFETMLPFLRDEFGNAASTNHGFGQRAREAVDLAQVQLATLLGASSNEIVWTSGATESDNLALKGVLHHRQGEGRRRLITVKTEHKAVLDSAVRLAREGADVAYLEIGNDGRVDLDHLSALVDEHTALVSVMLCNNEIGVIQDIQRVAGIAHSRGAWVHVDAAQGLGLVPFDVESCDVDLLSCTAHKLYGPKGVGALYVRRKRRRISVVSEIDGGGHQRGMRSGTLNVAGIVGFGKAADRLVQTGSTEAERLRGLRKQLWERLEPLGAQLNGPRLGAERHPGNLNVSFDGVDGPTLMVRLSAQLAVSSGAACSSASIEPSYVLRAIGCSAERATASVRFGLGESNDTDEVSLAADIVEKTVTDLRQGQKAGIQQSAIDDSSSAL